MESNINLRYLLFIAGTAALGGLLFGFDIAIITGAGPFLAVRFLLDDLSLGWAFSSLLFGCILGSFAAGRATGRYGRKRLLVIVAALFAVTSIATALAPTFSIFIFARFIGGIAVGGASLLSPMYVAEVSPASLRGRMGTLYQLSIITGIVISYCINYLLRNTGPDNWRWMFLTGVLPSALFLVLMILAPDSPRALVLMGNSKEALRILERITNAKTAQFQLAKIESTIHGDGFGRRGLNRRGVRRAIVTSFCLAILVHVSGINTVVDYAPAIFRSAGWKLDGALFSTLLVGLTELLFTIVSFWIIDRFGRKPLYIVGSLGMSGALGLLLMLALLGRFHGAVVLILILAYLAFFAACIGPVFWTLVPEIFPNDVRGAAMTVPVLTQWVANAVVVLFFPLAFNHLGKAITFGFLAVMAFLQAIFTWIFVPETKNKTLEEIESQWTVSKKVELVP